MTRRYAEGTAVPEDRSRQEIERLLRRHGATNVIVVALDEPFPAALAQFHLADRLIRLVKPLPVAGGTRAWLLMQRRRTWRVIVLWAKARLEAIASGDSTVEVEFLAQIALPEGGTVGDWLAPQLAEAYRGGTMPLALPAPRRP